MLYTQHTCVTSVLFMTNSPEGGHWMALKGMGWLIAMKIIQRLNLDSNSFFASYEGESGREVSNATRSNKNPKKCLSCSFFHIHHQCFVLVGGVLARNWEQDHDHKFVMISPTWKPKKQSLDRIRSTKSHIITLVYVDVFGVQESEKWCKMDTSGVPETPTEKQFCCWSTCKLPEPWMVAFFSPKKGGQRIWKKLDRMHMNEHEWNNGYQSWNQKVTYQLCYLRWTKQRASCLPTPTHDGSSEHFCATSLTLRGIPLWINDVLDPLECRWHIYLPICAAKQWFLDGLRSVACCGSYILHS